MYRAILLRMSDEIWPVWKDKIQPDVDIWFKANQLKRDEVDCGIPVVVLGTNGLGVVAVGETSDGISACEDQDWSQVTEEVQEEYKTVMNRIPVRIRRVHVQLEELKSRPAIAKLHWRRQTATPLSVLEYEALEELIPV